jgi:hypothetical protein
MWGQIASAALGAYGAHQAAKAAGQAKEDMQGAGNKAFDSGTYKPYGVTSGFGKSSFDGQNTSFAMDPRYQQQQSKMLGLGNQAYDAAGGDYNQLANNYFNQSRQLGAGDRLAEAGALGGSMFGTGRTGLQGSNESLGLLGEGTSSPDGSGYFANYEKQLSNDRFMSQQYAQAQRERDLTIGNNMMNQSMSFDRFGLDQGMMGAEMGQYRSQANNTAGGNLLLGYGAGAKAGQNQGMARAGGMIGLGNALGDWKSGGGGDGAFSNPMARMSNYNNFSNPNYYTPQEQGTAFTKYGNTASFSNPKYSDVGGYY